MKESAIVPPTNRRTRRPLTPWELPVLLTSVHAYRKGIRKCAMDRPHFAPILTYVYRNRYAVANQIQRRFPESLRSSRTARRHLEAMEALGYLAIAATRSTSPLWPKVYFVTKRGLKKLSAAYTGHGKTFKPSRTDRTRSGGFSADHVLHEVLTTEFLLALWQTIQGRPDLELLTIQRRSLAKHPAFRVVVDGTPSRLIPDALFLFRQRGNGMVCCFVEMDVGTMNAKQIMTKYRRYEAFARSEGGQRYLADQYRKHGATNPRPNFRVLVIAMDKTRNDDHRRMEQLAGLVRDVPASLRDRLWFATIRELREHQHDPLPLDAAIWQRGKDAPTTARPKGCALDRLFPRRAMATSPDGSPPASNGCTPGSRPT